MIRLIQICILVVIIGGFAACSFQSFEEDRPVDSDKAVSLSFILGEDDPGEFFYSDASFIMRNHDSCRSDFVVEHLRSIDEMFDFLQSFEHAVSQLNIVSHGNPWQGMSVPLFPHGTRTDKKNLKRALNQGMGKGLSIDCLNDSSVINVLSCGVGQDKEFADLVQRLFYRVSGSKPQLIMSDRFVEFDLNEGIVLADYLYSISKYRYKDPVVVINNLARKYPNAKVNFEDAYTMKNVEQGARKHGFVMAVNWQINLPKEQSKSGIRTELKQWMRDQPHLVEELRTCGLTFDDFHWNCFFEDNDASTVLRVKGFTFVEGILVKDLLNS